MFLSVFLIISFTGIIGARQPDIDINRVKLLSNEESSIHYPPSYRPQLRSLVGKEIIRNNDYDYHSGGLYEPRAPMHVVHDTPSSTNQKTPIKVHKSREDPRFFYQSEAYIKEINRKNVNREVSSIYPGQQVVRANERIELRSMPSRSKYREHSYQSIEDACIKCPHDRTIVAKPNTDRVILQKPRLTTCSGDKASRAFRYMHMYGPKFGSLLQQGSHMIVGRVMNKNKSLQVCKMQVHVVVQSCPIPKYLRPYCDNRSKSCNFTCKDPKTEVLGQSTLTCGNDMKWNGDLPLCKVRTWCDLPPPPERGRLSCQGATAGNSFGLTEGSKCRVRCEHGWRRSQRAAAICRRGAWTQGLTCQPKRNYTTMSTVE